MVALASNKYKNNHNLMNRNSLSNYKLIDFYALRNGSSLTNCDQTKNKYYVNSLEFKCYLLVYENRGNTSTQLFLQ